MYLLFFLFDDVVGDFELLDFFELGRGDFGFVDVEGVIMVVVYM